MTEPTLDAIEGKHAVTIDGQVVKLRYTLRALGRLREQLKVDDTDAMVALLDNGDMSPEALSLYLWAGRLWEQPDLKPDDMLDAQVSMWPAVHAVATAMRIAFLGTDPDPEPPAQDGAGKEDDPRNDAPGQ